jgi:hypothetical protein
MIRHVEVEDWKQWKDKVGDEKLDDGGFLSSSGQGVMVLPPVTLTEKKTSRRKLCEYRNLRDDMTFCVCGSVQENISVLSCTHKCRCMVLPRRDGVVAGRANRTPLVRASTKESPAMR